jgi:hypothetical protein
MRARRGAGRGGARSSGVVPEAPSERQQADRACAQVAGATRRRTCGGEWQRTSVSGHACINAQRSDAARAGAMGWDGGCALAPRRARPLSYTPLANARAHPGLHPVELGGECDGRADEPHGRGRSQLLLQPRPLLAAQHRRCPVRRLVRRRRVVHAILTQARRAIRWHAALLELARRQRGREVVRAQERRAERAAVQEEQLHTLLPTAIRVSLIHARTPFARLDCAPLPACTAPRVSPPEAEEELAAARAVLVARSLIVAPEVVIVLVEGSTQRQARAGDGATGGRGEARSGGGTLRSRQERDQSFG